MSENNHTVVSYKTQALVLFALIILTGLSVAVTQINLGPLTVTTALLLATTKAGLVLTYFMHLKFDDRFFSWMVAGVLTLNAIVIFITFLDYLYR